MKTEIYFFSGTGNAHYIAKTLGNSLGKSKLIHIGSLDLEKEIYSDADIIGVVFPIYFYDAPDIIKKFLSKLTIEATSYLFLYETFGGNGGNAITNCNKILSSRDIKLSNYFSLMLPDNCILFKQSEEKNKRLLDGSEKKILNAATHIKNFKTKITPKSKFKYSIMSNQKLKNASVSFLKFKKFTVDKDKCTSCGLCERVCPVNNIEFKTEYPSFKNKCEMCFACIHYCPSQCIKHGMMKNKTNYQYRNPNVSMIEVMNK
ncbi:EFR1 family ferrodoxin [uncultured Clostridium sp.]|jgi:ferredoxin/flavodoxin|uniref:EFR1 family ferrodoxin n=1 Tax=uncultured Clostridium sp. TaxID=59620 RepID=UPI002629F12E|nr:EFR1 family ferrodoxin [uncultured Clostridium sp.]